MNIISQGPQFVGYCVKALDDYGIPVITPGGGLGAHLDAGQFVSHIPQEQYPAGALVCALYICSGVRGMERGTLSEERNADGSERLASMELVRLAFPRRVFTLSQTEYVIDRVKWLYDHRDLIGIYRRLRPGAVTIRRPPWGRLFFQDAMQSYRKFSTKYPKLPAMS